MEDPLETGEKILEILESYGEVSGFKLNKSKTKMLTKNLSEDQKKRLEETLGLQIVKKIKYLGIWITARCSALKEDNYIPLLKKVKQDLERWGKLQISLLGRIASIKMSVLPKFLYLFQTAPVYLDKRFFLELNSIIRKYIWGGKKPRIALRILQDKKSRGGFGLPAWEIYYKAANLVWLREWATLENKRILTLEGYDLQRGWHAYLWENSKRTRTYFHRHKIRDALMQTWREIRHAHYIKVPKWISTMEAMIYPNMLGMEKMYKYKDILDSGGNLKTNETLKEHGILIDWWPYLLIKSRFHKDKKEFGIELGTNDLDKIWLGAENNLLAKLYAYLLEYDREEEIVKDQMITWAKNIGHSIKLDEWESVWNCNLKLTRAVAYKENQYKMLYRWHLAPARIAKIYSKASPKCWKCGHQQGSYYHMWWTCPEVIKFWKKIRSWTQEIIDERVDLEPEIFLLGIPKKNYQKEKRYLLLHIITAARIIYAKYWKEEGSPPEEQIICKILECAEMCRLTYMINEEENSKFYAVWERWYEWLDSKRKKKSE